MMFKTRRPISRMDICNYNTLLYRDYDTNIDLTKNYFLSQSPPPMTYRDLRSVMSNIKPSNVIVLPETFNSSQTLRKNSPGQTRRKHISRKKYKRQGVDVYRTLVRTESRCSPSPDRDITNDEMKLLANSFIVDHVSPSPTSGFFHPRHLPNIQKHRINNNNNNRIENNHTKGSYLSSPSLRIEHIGIIRPTPVEIQYENNNNRIVTSQIKARYRSSSSLHIQHAGPVQATPPQLIHRTTPVDIQYKEGESHMIITTTTTATTIISPPIPETQTRKQLHVYMPQIISC